MGQSFTSLHYHITFSTRGRAAMIKPVIQERLYEYMGGIIRAQKGEFLTVGGMPDHVHLLARLHQQTNVADVLRNVKAGSSRWVHEEFPAFGSFRVAERLRSIHRQLLRARSGPCLY